MDQTQFINLRDLLRILQFFIITKKTRCGENKKYLRYMFHFNSSSSHPHTVWHTLVYCK